MSNFDFETHNKNFRDRMEAVRYALVQNNLPVTALIAAYGHYDMALRAAQPASPTPPADSEVVAAAKRLLMARVLATADSNHSAAMEEFRNSLAALQELVGFDARTPFGRPAVGSHWVNANGDAITVQGIYVMDGHEYVAATTKPHGGILVRLLDWHLKAKPAAPFTNQPDGDVPA